MSVDLQAELAEYGRRQRAERQPVDIADIFAVTDASVVTRDDLAGSGVDVGEPDVDRSGGETLTFDSRWRVDDGEARSERTRWIGALAAVAATILVVVGIAVVADREQDDVVPSTARIDSTALSRATCGPFWFVAPRAMSTLPIGLSTSSAAKGGDSQSSGSTGCTSYIM